MVVTNVCSPSSRQNALYCRFYNYLKRQNKQKVVQFTVVSSIPHKTIITDYNYCPYTSMSPHIYRTLKTNRHCTVITIYAASETYEWNCLIVH